MSIPLKADNSKLPKIFITTADKILVKGPQWIKTNVHQVGRQSNKPVMNGIYLYHRHYDFWSPSDKENSNITGHLVHVKDSRMSVPFSITDPRLELYLPAGTVIGSLKTTDILVNAITKTLTHNEKRDKVIKELKIDANDYINEVTKNSLKSLVDEFLDVFSESKCDLGDTDLMEAEINLDNGDQPIVEQYRRPPVHLLSLVAKEIEDLLDAGVIRESQSPFNTATVIVKKPDGSVRLCIDYRSLNKHTISVTAPLPPLDMVTSQVGGKKYYSKMDLTKGYYAIRIREDHVYKTVWSIPGLGAYEFIRLPLGLKNSPSYFCQLLSRLFRGLDHQICFVYLDDIITSSNDCDTMLSRLRTIFERLRYGKLKLSPNKCEFLSPRIMFLGSWISQKGCEADQDKVNATLKLPFPTTKKKLQSFLGAANWFRGLIKNYAALCSPLTNLLSTESNKISPDEASEKSFKEVKEALSSMTVMVLPDLTKEFVIYCDASFLGLGASIGHEFVDGNTQCRPIAYASRVLTGPEKKWKF